MTMTEAPRVKSDAWSENKRPKLRVNVTKKTKRSDIRPLTATLDHPLILDPNLLTTLDMTGFTKAGLLTITRLCGLTLVPKINKPRRRAFLKRGSVSPRENQDEESLMIKGQGKSPTDQVFGSLVKNSVPDPCRTCGRTDYPERFHSHPKKPESKKLFVENCIPVSKVVPANFRSVGKNDRDHEICGVQQINEKPMERGKSARPKAITCYICLRDFGMASFTVHEPKCIQKWERENDLLPVDQRRKMPKRPNVPVHSKNWNDLAWKATQDSLVPCQTCKRTFPADQLPVHQSSCNRPSSTSSQSSIGQRPRMVFCYICGREFGTKSIAIHEPQCLNKWRQQNLMLPAKLRQPEPVRSDSLADVQAVWKSHLDSLVACGKCGRKFFPERIQRHEEICAHVVASNNGQQHLKLTTPRP